MCTIKVTDYETSGLGTIFKCRTLTSAGLKEFKCMATCIYYISKWKVQYNLGNEMLCV